MMKASVCLCSLFALTSIFGADAPAFSERLAKHLGPKTLDYFSRVKRIEAYKVGEEDASKSALTDRVGSRLIIGDPVELNKEQMDELLRILHLDDTCFRAGSKGTSKAAVGYRMWTDRKECMELSCCLIKGGMHLTLKDTNGKVIYEIGAGGFRDDKSSPMRTLAAVLFPNDKDIAAAVPKKM